MKHIITFAASYLSMSRKTHRLIYTTLGLLLMLITSVGFAKAQSKDRGKPTQLTSNEISGLIEPDNSGDVYYYSFLAGPGEGTITLTVEATRDSAVSVGFRLSNEDSRIISDGGVIAHRAMRTDQRVINVNLTRSQRLILSISLAGGNPGKYRFQFSGVLDVGKDVQSSSNRTAPSAGGTDYTEAITRKKTELPEEGSLYISLPEGAKLSLIGDDGSIKELDLSKVDGIFVKNGKGRIVLTLYVPHE